MSCSTPFAAHNSAWTRISIYWDYNTCPCCVYDMLPARHMHKLEGEGESERERETEGHKNTLATAVCQLLPLDSRPKALQFHSFSLRLLLLLLRPLSLAKLCTHLLQLQPQVQWVPFTPHCFSLPLLLAHISKSQQMKSDSWECRVQSAEFTESERESRIVCRLPPCNL